MSPLTIELPLLAIPFPARITKLLALPKETVLAARLESILGERNAIRSPKMIKRAPRPLRAHVKIVAHPLSCSTLLVDCLLRVFNSSSTLKGSD